MRLRPSAALAFPQGHKINELADPGKDVVRVARIFHVVYENKQALVAVLSEELLEILAGGDIVGSVVTESLSEIDHDSSAVVVLDEVIDMVVSFKEIRLDLA